MALLRELQPNPKYNSNENMWCNYLKVEKLKCFLSYLLQHKTDWTTLYEGTDDNTATQIQSDAASAYISTLTLSLLSAYLRLSVVIRVLPSTEILSVLDRRPSTWAALWHGVGAISSSPMWTKQDTVVDIRSSRSVPKTTSILQGEAELVENYRYLGVHLDNRLEMQHRHFQRLEKVL